MAGKGKWIFAPALVIVLVVFAFFILGRSDNNSLRGQRLPDGSTFRLGTIQLTNGSFSFTANGYMGWRGKIARFLPNNLLDRLHWMRLRGGITFGGGGMATNVCVFTIREGPSSKTPNYDLRLLICDDLGNRFDAGTTMGIMSTSDTKNFLRVDGWCPPAFPRRGKTLDLRYYPADQTNSPCVAEFFIANPAPGNYPTWEPEPLPATKTNGDLSITLLSLKSGLSKVDESKPAASNEIAVTQAAFRIVQGGSESNAWRPKQVEIKDATGNHWIPFPSLVSNRFENATDYFSFSGALWPGEAAWKLRFEFSRITDFQPDELFTFSGITVPGATQVIKLDDSTNIAGCKAQLIAITGATAWQPGNLKWSTVKKRTNISVRVTPFPKDARLTLLKVVDESGREAEINQQPDWKAAERVYGFKTPEGAKQLSFTFALHKSRYVEFMARPEFAHSNN